jgi:hypothetical protein
VGTIKRHATDKGNAGKDATIVAERARGFKPVDDNEADALAPLLWAIKTETAFNRWQARLERASKMGQRDIRQVLILCVSAVVTLAGRKGPPQGLWLARMMMAKRPRMVAVALANKIAGGPCACRPRGDSERAVP